MITKETISIQFAGMSSTGIYLPMDLGDLLVLVIASPSVPSVPSYATPRGMASLTLEAGDTNRYSLVMY